LGGGGQDEKKDSSLGLAEQQRGSPIRAGDQKAHVVPSNWFLRKMEL